MRWVENALGTFSLECRYGEAPRESVPGRCAMGGKDWCACILSTRIAEIAAYYLRYSEPSASHFVALSQDRRRGAHLDRFNWLSSRPRLWDVLGPTRFSQMSSLIASRPNKLVFGRPRKAKAMSGFQAFLLGATIGITPSLMLAKWVLRRRLR
jgi:hypothetical protein